MVQSTFGGAPEGFRTSESSLTSSIVSGSNCSLHHGMTSLSSQDVVSS